jgi:hypothetical protein
VMVGHDVSACRVVAAFVVSGHRSHSSSRVGRGRGPDGGLWVPAFEITRQSAPGRGQRYVSKRATNITLS